MFLHCMYRGVLCFLFTVTFLYFVLCFRSIRERKNSLPDLLDFERYSKTKRMPRSADVREWVRDIWNKWFDEVFPPTPDESEAESDDDTSTQMEMRTESSDVHSKEKKRYKKVLLGSSISHCLKDTFM